MPTSDLTPLPSINLPIKRLAFAGVFILLVIRAVSPAWFWAYWRIEPGQDAIAILN